LQSSIACPWRYCCFHPSFACTYVRTYVRTFGLWNAIQDSRHSRKSSLVDPIRRERSRSSNCNLSTAGGGGEQFLHNLLLSTQSVESFILSIHTITHRIVVVVVVPSSRSHRCLSSGERRDDGRKMRAHRRGGGGGGGGGSHSWRMALRYLRACTHAQRIQRTDAHSVTPVAPVGHTDVHACVTSSYLFGVPCTFRT